MGSLGAAEELSPEEGDFFGVGWQRASDNETKALKSFFKAILCEYGNR